MADKTLGVSVVVGAALGKAFGSTFRTATEQMAELGATAKRLRVGRALTGDILKLQNKLRGLRAEQKKAGGSSDKLTKEIKDLERKLGQANKAAATHGVKIGDAAREHRKFSAALTKSERGLGRLQSREARKQRRQALHGRALPLIGAAYTASLPIRAAIGFESTMADVKKVVDFDTPQQFKAMSSDILKLSTVIPMSAEGIGDIVAAAGQAGIAREELTRFAEDAAKMGVAFDMAGAEAGSAMTGLRTIFKLNQDQVVSLGDAYNHLSNNMDATARGMLNIANRTGSTAEMFGLSGQQVGALGATFLALKTKPEVAATGINILLLRLQTADKQGTKFQQALASIGMSAQGLKKAIKQDAQGALLGFLEAVKSSDDQAGTLADLFGAEYSDDMTKLVGGLDLYRKSLGLVADQTSYAGSMQAEYEARSETTANKLQLLRNQFTKLGVNVGSVVLPALSDMAGVVGSLVGRISELADRFPVLTKVVVGSTVALVGLKAAALAAAYAGTFMGGAWVKSLRGITLATLTSPLGLWIAGIAIAALLIYKYWEPIKTFFKGVWEGFTEALEPVFGALKPVGEAIGWIGNIFKPVAAEHEEQLSGIAAAYSSVGYILGTVTPVVLGLTVALKAGKYAWTGIKTTWATAGKLIGWTRTKLLAFNQTALITSARTKALAAGGAIKSFGASLVTFATKGVIAAVVGFKALIASTWAWTAALLANPMTWVVVGIMAAIAAVWAIYKYWTPITEFFEELWGKVTGYAGQAWEWIKGVWGSAMGWFSGLWDSVMDWFGGLSLAGMGKALIQTLITGLKAAPGAVYAGLKAVLGPVGKLLPSSDAQEGPLSRLTASGGSILGTLGEGVRRTGPVALKRSMARALGTATAGLALTLPVAAQAAPAAMAARPPSAAYQTASASDGGARYIDSGIHIQQLTINQLPGEDARALATRILDEIERQRRQQLRASEYDAF